AAGDAYRVDRKPEAGRREGAVRGEDVLPVEHSNSDAADLGMAAAKLCTGRRFPAFVGACIGRRQRCAEAQQDEERRAARASAGCRTGQINRMQAIAEALQRHVGGFFGGFQGRLSDLLARNGGVGYATPMILRPELAAQPNRVAHTLLPSAPLLPGSSIRSVGPN